MNVFFSPNKISKHDDAISEGTRVKVVIGQDSAPHFAKSYIAIVEKACGCGASVIPILVQNECGYASSDGKEIDSNSAANLLGEDNHYLCPRQYLWAIDR